MREIVLSILASICEDEIVKDELDVDLFKTGLLDSLSFIDVLLEIEEQLGIEIPPTEIEREKFSTANQILEIIERKMKE